MRSIPALAALAALFVASCGGTEPRLPDDATTADLTWAVVPEPLALPAGAGSAQPHLSASGRGIILSWLDHSGQTATLRFAERTRDGWSDVRTVASGDDWFVSWADVPSVVRLADGTLVAHWYTNTDPLIEAYDLWLSYSRDEGRVWSEPFTPHDDGTRTQHGFATLFQPPDGGLGIVWLDGRAMELDTTSPDGGAMSLRAATYDAAWTKITDVEIDGRVCECCTTSVAVAGDSVVTAYRDRSLREIRDIHVSRLEDGTWTYGRPVSVDNWRINACPVNGPAIASRDEGMAAAWFSARENRPRAFAAFSADAGRTWGEPIRLDDQASLGHVAIELLEDGSAVASWVELADARSRLHIRRIDPSGARSAAVDVTSAFEGRVSGYPRMARHGDELVFAWTESSAAGDGMQQVKGAVARLPRP
jgi:hypothetical protein